MSPDERKPRDIGLDITPPEAPGAYDDPHDPFFGSLSVRGQVLDGVVVEKKMQRTVVVARERRYLLDKYQRFEKRTSKHLAHLPASLTCTVGDRVKIAECRPISKAKHFVVVQVTPDEAPIESEEATL